MTRFPIIVPIVLLSLAATSQAKETHHFENDIEPLFSRYNCNSSGCHGKAEGQGGFKLSVFGFDPDGDFSSIVKEGRGRRVMPAAADESLLLLKATGRMAHGGGTKLRVESRDYRTLRDWIAEGMPIGDPNAPTLTRIRVEPSERILGRSQQLPLRVIAHFSDGHEQEVTEHARFQTNHEALATVNVDGMVRTSDIPGEVAVMAAYRGEVAVFRAIVPRPETAPAPAAPQFNFIDQCVDRKLAKLNIHPSDICDDATFLRRSTLDLTGMLPTTEEARTFLADRTKNKREKWIDELLSRPAFADLMALRWADILRVDRQALGHQRAYTYYRWIRESFLQNKPFDRFAREWLTADGPLVETGPANFYKVVTKPGEMASTFSQVFLGVRIACAECHHHPADRWSQTDYAGMVAFFTPLTVKGAADTEVLVNQGDPITKHPRTGQPVFAYSLGTRAAEANPRGDRRLVLADWMSEPSNPFFARNLANRVWAQLLGRGLVEPVDDVRATNPPANPELLDALAKFVVDNQYDVKKLVRLICASRVYQTGATPNETNEKDEQNYSRAYFKRPDAEILLDMIGQATGVPDRFPGSPVGTRAVQLWDSKVKNDFLRLFGRPMRASACECERNHEPSTGQVLNLLNSSEVQRKLSHESGLVVKQIRQFTNDRQLVDEFYLRFFSRFPSDEERDRALAHMKKHANNRRQAAEDLAWALLNTLEFQFNH